MKELEQPIIPSLLWTDLYKFTMGQVAFRFFPDLIAKYEFINRGKTQFPKGFADRLREQVQMMSELSLKKDEKSYLQSNCPYLGQDYLQFLSNYRFNPDEVEIEQTGGDVSVTVEGPWKNSILWEVPLMTTISELYFEMTGQSPDDQYLERASAKGLMLREHMVKFLEFGTRRAFSTKVHREVLQVLIEAAGLARDGGSLLGTSNVALAKEFNIPVSGTYAHELVMAMAALFGPAIANQKAMEFWAKQYLGLDGGEKYPKLGTALTDTFTTDVFLKTFSKFWAEYFTNLRQDSGDPIEVGEKMVAHLLSISVDPKQKGIVFSDGLNIPKAIAIHEHFKDRINPIFGIGTDFTNDVGVKALNIVIKLFGVKTSENGVWIPTVKISDNPTKASGDPVAVDRYLCELRIPSIKNRSLVSVVNTI